MADLMQAGFGTIRPTIKVADLKGAKNTVLTVSYAEPTTRGKGVNKQNLLEMRFLEFPEKSYFPNATGISDLIVNLGSQTSAWRGKKVPLQVDHTTNPTTDEEVDALHVSPAESWEGLLEEAAEEELEVKPRRRRVRKTK